MASALSILGKTASDRTITVIIGALAAVHAANGLYMFLAPQTWFFSAPGVVDTGSFNRHFVQDVGSAYIMTAVAAGFAIATLALRFPLMALSSVFVGLHAVIHVVDIAEGRCGDPTDDILAVILPALIWLGVTAWSGRTGATKM